MKISNKVEEPVNIVRLKGVRGTGFCTRHQTYKTYLVFERSGAIFIKTPWNHQI
jgi:hypothetical protein